MDFHCFDHSNAISELIYDDKYTENSFTKLYCLGSKMNPV